MNSGIFFSSKGTWGTAIRGPSSPFWSSTGSCEKLRCNIGKWRIDEAMVAWLASKPHRKPTSVSMDAAVLRQFCSYLRRQPACPLKHEPMWPQLPTQSTFIPYVLSESDVKRLLSLCTTLSRPTFRALYSECFCWSSIAPASASAKLCSFEMVDVDVQAGVLFVRMFKGRARWVPFHRSLAREMEKYLLERQSFAGELTGPDQRFFHRSYGSGTVRQQRRAHDTGSSSRKRA